MATILSRTALAAAFVAGAAGTFTAHQLFGSSSSTAAARFQNEHTWVARKNPDGGTTPIYAGKSCGYALLTDGGIGADICSYDGAELTDAQGKAFEGYLKALGVAPPRL